MGSTCSPRAVFQLRPHGRRLVALPANRQRAHPVPDRSAVRSRPNVHRGQRKTTPGRASIRPLSARTRARTAPRGPLEHTRPSRGCPQSRSPRGRHRWSCGGRGTCHPAKRVGRDRVRQEVRCRHLLEDVAAITSDFSACDQCGQLLSRVLAAQGVACSGERFSACLVPRRRSRTRWGISVPPRGRSPRHGWPVRRRRAQRRLPCRAQRSAPVTWRPWHMTRLLTAMPRSRCRMNRHCTPPSSRGRSATSARCSASRKTRTQGSARSPSITPRPRPTVHPGEQHRPAGPLLRRITPHRPAQPVDVRLR